MTRAQTEPRLSRRVARVVGSLVISALALWLVQRQLDPVPEDLAVAPHGVPLYLGTLLVYAFLRTSRWYFLVRPIGAVRLADVLLAGLAGTLWIVALPWRLGELVRPALLARRTGLPLPQLLGTVAVERVVDGLVVCGMFFLAAAQLPQAAAIAGLRPAALLAAALFAAALALLLALARWPALPARLLARAPRLAGAARGLAEGLRALPSPAPLACFLLLTLAYWAVNAFGMALLARACDVPLGPLEVVAVLAVLNLTLMVPGPPAHVGTFQLGVAAGLGLFLDPELVRARGSSYTFLLYTCQLGVIAALGVAASARLRLGVAASERPPAA